MLASTIQFTTNPPTPTHNPRQPGAPDGSGNQGALPQNPDSMPPPHTQARAGAPTTTNRQQRACLLHQAPDNQPPHTTVHDGQPPSLPREQPPRPAQTHTAQTTTTRKPPHTIPILRKEVIQPHLPVRLPCYDFVPITSPTFDRSP